MGEEARDALLDAVHDVAAEVSYLRDTLTPPAEERGYRTRPRVPWAGIPGIRLALRLCRYQDEMGKWHGLAERFKQVPADAITEDGRVQCVCGAVVAVGASLAPCEGECGRFFASDHTGAVWAVLVPDSPS
jgi:hypothetical protein